MTDRTVEVGIGFKAGDKSGVELIKATAASLDRARVALANAQKQGGLKKVVAAGELSSLEALTQTAAQTSQELIDVESALQSLADTDPGFAEKAKQADDLKVKLIELSAAASDVPAKLEGVGGGAGAGGGAPRGLTGKEAASQTIQGVGGLAANVSPGFAQAAQIATQALQVGDGFKKLSGILIDAPGIIGAVATSAATIAAPLGATAAGFAAVATILLPVALAVAGLAVVISHLNDKARQGEESAQKYVEALEGQIKTDREIADLLKSGDVAGAKKRYQELLKAQEDSNAELTYLYQKKADIDKQYADAQKNLNLDQLAYLGSEGGKVSDRIKEIYEKQFTPATAAVEQFGAALDKIAQAANEKEGIDNQIKALQQRATVETQLADIIRAGNTGAITQRRQAIEAELNAIGNELTGLKALGATNEDVAAAVKEAESRQRDLNNELNLYSPAAQKAAAAQEELNKQNAATLAGYVQQIQTLQQVAGLLKQGSTSSLDDRLTGLNSERDAILSQLDSIRELGKTSTDAAAKAKEYEQRLIAINDEYSQLSAARPDVRLAEITKGQDEMIKAEVVADRKIADIRAAGLQKIADIEAAASDARAAAAARLSDTLARINADENKSVGKVDSDYMASELKAWERFRKDTEKLDRQNAKARLKIIDDTNAALLQAEKANDVIAFIAAAEKGKEALKQQDEQASEAAAERQALFLEERQAAKEQHDQRVLEIRAQAEESRAAAQKQYEDDLKAAEKQHDEQLKAQQKQQAELIAAEEAALLQRVSAIQDTYNLEDSLLQDMFDKRKARYGEDDKIIADRLALELQRHADDLKIKADAEIRENQRAVKTKADTETKVAGAVASTIAQNFGSATTAIQTGLTRFIDYIKAKLQGAASSSGSSYGGGSGSGSGGSSGTSPTGTGRVGGVAFDNGGVVTKPTFALIGENLKAGQVEAVVKFRPSEGIPPGFMGGKGGGINLYLQSVNIGAGNAVTRADLDASLIEMGNQILTGLQTARGATE